MPDRPRTPSDQVAWPRDTATRWVFDKTQAPWAVEASSWGSVALSTDELDRGPGLPERWVAKHYSTRHRREVGLDVISTRVCTFSRIPIVFYTKPGAESGGRQVLPLCFFRGSAGVPRCAPRPTELASYFLTTLSGGSLGSGVDEERSQLRELM